MGGTPTPQVGLLIIVLGNSSLRGYLLFGLSCPSIWVMDLALNSGKIFGLGMASSVTFPRLFHLSSLYNASVSQFFSQGDLSWNFHFIRNLNYREVIELESLLPLLNPISLSSAPDFRIWTLTLLVVLLVNPIFFFCFPLLT